MPLTWINTEMLETQRGVIWDNMLIIILHDHAVELGRCSDKFAAGFPY